MESLVEAAVRTAGDLWQKGWAERNAGNLSMRLESSDLEGVDRVEGPWQAIGVPVAGMAGRCVLLTAAGSTMHDLERAPDAFLGVIEVDETGARYRVVRGLVTGCSPTSELPSHLRAHAARLHRGEAGRGVILHTHPPHLIALTYALDLDTPSLTRLLWEMHTECIVVLPEGCAFVPWRLPGSDDLARATAQALERRSLVLWPHHGIVAAGPDLETAFGLIDTAEKAAGIYLAVAALGPVRHRLATAQLRALAERFGVHPDLEILASSSLPDAPGSGAR